jgi:hypothetical protein
MDSDEGLKTLTVSPEAREYIRKGGGAVTIRMVKGNAGCCSMLSPVVEIRTPTDREQFMTIQSDEVTLYLHKDLEIMPGGVTIDLNKLLWVKKLDVRGLDILP